MLISIYLISFFYRSF